MNKVILIGRLTKDIELMETQGGLKVARFTVAVPRKFDKENTDFINIVVWRTLAENCAKYLKKGSQCAIVGTLQNRSYDAKDGTKRTVTEVVADEVEFISEPNGKSKKDEENKEELTPTDEWLPF